MAILGLDEMHYAICTHDDEDGVTYTTPTKIKGAIEVSDEPETNTETLYADNMAYETESAMGEVKVSIELADLPLKDHAALLGHEVKDGVMVCKGDDKAPYVAVMFKNEKSDGGTRFVKLLKGKFTEPSSTSHTKRESPEYQTPTIEASFISRKYDKQWKRVADSSDADFKGEKTWFSSVE